MPSSPPSSPPPPSPTHARRRRPHRSGGDVVLASPRAERALTPSRRVVGQPRDHPVAAILARSRVERATETGDLIANRHQARGLLLVTLAADAVIDDLDLQFIGEVADDDIGLADVACSSVLMSASWTTR